MVSNPQNALSLRWLLSQAVHHEYMRLPRFPLSVHRNLRSARFPLSLHRTLRSARFPLRCHRARILTAFPRRSHARVRFGQSVSGLSVVGACEACGPCHAPHAVFFFPDDHLPPHEDSSANLQYTCQYKQTKQQNNQIINQKHQPRDPYKLYASAPKTKNLL
jgi:hypothetical protein